MTERTVVGLEPRLPWLLHSMAWWTAPVRAERLAALRIGVAAALLIDILGCYLPYLDAFLGPHSLGAPEVFAASGADGIFRWSVFRWSSDPRVTHLLFFAWGASSLLLLLGFYTRLSAVAAWGLSLSAFHVNPFLVNSGDNARDTLLFILMLCPCGAVWSIDARRRRNRPAGPTYVWPWPLRLLFVQLTVLYFMTGVFKLMSPDWRGGTAMHYFLGNIAWTRLPYEYLPGAELFGPVFDYVTLTWELGFPVLVFLGATRKPTLWLGVLFHVGTGLLFRIGAFPLYMLCFYLPLVPWERYLDSQPADDATSGLSPGAAPGLSKVETPVA
jgi:hypothetical protein